MTFRRILLLSLFLFSCLLAVPHAETVGASPAGGTGDSQITSPAEPIPWKNPAATARISLRTLPPYSAVFVPVPEEWSDFSAADAENAQGKRIPSFLVRHGSNLIGIVIPTHFDPETAQAVRQEHITQPTHVIYLKKDNASPQSAISAIVKNPVTLTRHSQRLTTRPQTAEEMIRLFAAFSPHHQRIRPRMVPDLGAYPAFLENSATPTARHFAVIYQWDAQWLVQESATLRFGADQDASAWTILLDGNPVANWQDTEDIEKRPQSGRFCKPVTVAPGLHSVQFLSVLNKNEVSPHLLVKTSADHPEGAPLTNLLPLHRPTRVTYETQGTPLNAASTSFEPLSVFTFQDTGEACQLSEPVPEDIPCHPTGLLHRSGNRVLLAEATSGIPARRLAMQPMGTTLTLPAAAFLQRSTGIHVTAHLSGVSPLVSRTDNILQGKLAIDWPQQLPLALASALVLQAEQCLPDSTTVSTDSLRVASNTRPLPFSILLHPGASSVRISASLAGARPFQELTIQIRRPSEANLPLIPAGSGLFDGTAANASPVSCWLEPIPKPSSTCFQPPAIPFPASLLIVDDFIATQAGPLATHEPEDAIHKFFSGKRQRPSGVFRVSAAAQPGASPGLALLGVLPSLSLFRPDAAILSIGSLPLKAGLSVQETTDQIQYIAQACQAMNISPIFVTLPPLPGIATETSRAAALAVKQLAIRMHAPVMDLYGTVLREKIDTASWNQPRPGMTIDTLHDGVRDWIATKLALGLTAISTP